MENENFMSESGAPEYAIYNWCKWKAEKIIDISDVLKNEPLNSALVSKKAKFLP